ncbi:MAG: hypothetical protein ACREYB_02600 [Casimicrobiaceae bacterium]
MDRRLDWIASNGMLAAALYLAVVAQAGWAHYAIAAFTWWTLANCLSALLGGPGSRPVSLPLAPQAPAMIFDLAVLAVMFAAHWYWTACAYAAMSGCAVLVRERSTSKR